MMPTKLEAFNRKRFGLGLKRHGVRSLVFQLVYLGAFSTSASLRHAHAQIKQDQGLSDLTIGIRSSSSSNLVRAVDGENTAHALPAETLGNSDLIEITVPYIAELSHSFRIGTNGLLVLPLLHQEMQVEGLTVTQVAARIRQALIAEQLMPDPVVTVSVLEYRSRTVSINGAVVHPLTFQATGEVTLLDAIAMAGGIVSAGATDVLISSRHHNAQGAVEVAVKTVPVRSLLLHADADANILLHGGEEIRVTEASKVFVAGNVVKPGVYTMQGNEDTTVLKALALSAGLQQYSGHVAYIYRRSADGGDRKEIRVPLARIIARKDPDIGLIADDILYVPENNGKRMTARVLAQLSGFGQTTATGLLIYK